MEALGQREGDVEDVGPETRGSDRGLLCVHTAGVSGGVCATGWGSRAHRPRAGLSPGLHYSVPPVPTHSRCEELLAVWV